jgi:magnesium transporter
VSEPDGGPAAAQGRQQQPIRVPCLHNPAHHEIDFHLSSGQFVWIDLEGPDDDDLKKVSEHIKLHPLTLEDARVFRQRPKIEDYENYMYMVVFGVDPGTESGDSLLREVHLIISGDAVVSLHRRPNDALEDLRRRYDDRQVRSEQFLVYQILDAIISTFVPVLSRIDEAIDDIEESIIARPREEDLRRIYSMKRDLVAMRRVVTPMRDMFQRNADRLSQLQGLETDDKLYFRDLYDNLIRVSEIVDAYRDLLSGATDLYLSTVANRQGEVNRQLTIIATIFLPLTFFTGFFGQNFSLLVNHIINRDWSFWVFGVGLLVVSVFGFWLFFRSKGWIGKDATLGTTPPSAAGDTPPPSSAGDTPPTPPAAVTPPQ